MQMRHRTGAAAVMAVAGLLGLGVEASADPVMPSNPVSGWTFDGHLEDVFGSNDGTAPNGMVYVEDGPFGGQALDLTGNTTNVNDVQRYVNIGNPESLQLTTNMTVATWIRLSPSNNWTYPIAKYENGERQWAMGVEWGRYTPRFSTTGSNVLDTRPADGMSSINNGEWRHLAFTVDEDNGLAVYIDGVKVDEWHNDEHRTRTETTKVLHDGDANIVVGAISSADGNFFRGQIGETAIWNTVLSDDEIAWLAQNSFSTIPEPGSLGLLGAGAGLILVRRK